jgi:hypothetical protein
VKVIPRVKRQPKPCNAQERFCSGLGWSLPLQWFDRIGIVQLDPGRVARVELATLGTANHYPGFDVSIVHKQSGLVDSKYFMFDDYLPGDQRSDERPDYPNRPNARERAGFHVLGSSRDPWRWYIAVPSDTRPFTKAVEAYIGAFAL